MNDLLLDQLTVVVTNFRREGFLRRCLDSVRESGIRHLVVTTSEPVEETLRVIEVAHSSFLAPIAGMVPPKKTFELTSVPQDLGNNEAWLRGVSMVKTRWVLILHDDDVLVPENFRAAENELFEHLNGDQMVCWCGRCINEAGAKFGTNSPLPVPRGVSPASAIVQSLMRPGALAISPVLGIFTTEQARRTLRECEEKWAGQGGFFTRPKMMVGNDMLLWLQAAERHQHVFFSYAEITAHGHHAMSETVAAHNHPRKMATLQTCYRNTQEYHKRNRYGQHRFTTSAIYHLVPGFPTHDEGTLRRHRLADASWSSLYNTGSVYRLAITPDKTPRDAKNTMGETRDLPFIRDLIDYGAQFAAPDDWLVLTNRDICVQPELFRNAMSVGGSAWYSHRMDSMAPLARPLTHQEVPRLRQYPGADLFAFRKSWWTQWRTMFPDMLLGFEAWDWMFWTLMFCTTPNGSPPINRTPVIYHEWHESYWEQPSNRTTCPGQVHNRRLAREFLRARHGYTQNNLE